MAEFKGIQLKRSSSPGEIPSSAQLVEGELAINLSDKVLYSKNSTGVFSVLPAANSLNYDRLTNTAKTDLLAAVYPIGSIYINAGANTNPATLLGFGTWTAFGAGQVMVGLSGSDALFDTLGETGGSKNAVTVSHTHTATVTDPGHAHAYLTPQQDLVGGGGNGIRTISTSLGTATTSAVTGISVANASAGVSGTNANLQPYITVAMWKRTA
jgi:hypothetical protein